MKEGGGDKLHGGDSEFVDVSKVPGFLKVQVLIEACMGAGLRRQTHNNPCRAKTNP